MPDVPRDRTSAAFARAEAERRAYAEHLARVQQHRYRVGMIAGRWRIARREPRGWRLLEDSLAAFPDIDPAAERGRLTPWVVEVLGVRTVWLWRDLERPDAFHADVQS